MMMMLIRMLSKILFIMKMGVMMMMRIRMLSMILMTMRIKIFQ